MPNRIILSKLNPVTFRPVAPNQLPQYLSHNYNIYRYYQTLQPWEEEAPYVQKYMRTDTIKLQFTSNFAAIAVSVTDCEGRNYYSGNFNKVRQSLQFLDSYIYEHAFSVGDYMPAGRVYFVNLLMNDVVTHVSEPIFVSEFATGTMLVEYSNRKYHEGIIFETGFVPQVRVEAYIGRLLPGSSDQLFIDQSYDSRQISSKPYSAFEVTFGDERGLPDYMIDKLNYIWSCSSVRLDGQEYSKESEAAFEMSGSDRYPMRSFKMKLLEGVNRGASIYEPGGTILDRLNTVANIDADVFGQMPVNNGSVIQVVAFE